MSEPAIALADVVKDYRGLRPLRVRALTVGARERVAIAGLDRAAAEVFVNLVNGATLPDSGVVRVFGESTDAIATDTAWLASLDRFGIVTERAVLLEAASVEQNMALPFSLEIDPMPADLQRRVRTLAGELSIDEATLASRAGDVPPVLRMRIHLARALAAEPRVLLMEHPTASLPREDVIPFAEIVDRLSGIRGLAVVALTDDEAFAGIVAKRRLKLNGATGVLSDARGWRRWLG
jgi:ABC-type lipoprotein export system ATPase subunit